MSYLCLSAKQLVGVDPKPLIVFIYENQPLEKNPYFSCTNKETNIFYSYYHQEVIFMTTTMIIKILLHIAVCLISVISDLL